jgi:hypothetical protein
MQPHQDVVVMIAKATAENIDASGVGGVVVDADAQPQSSDVRPSAAEPASPMKAFSRP